MIIKDLTGEQARQTIDAERVFAAYRDVRSELDRRFPGSMSWKTVKGRQYLYRRRRNFSTSLGVRGPDTERTHRQFHEGR